MSLSEYFENRLGRGVLATADSSGNVDIALYSRPHFMNEENIAFIMTDRLMHKNLQSNPHAAFLFMESGAGFTGKRLFLTKVKEDDNPAEIDKVRTRKSYAIPEGDEQKKKFLVFFHIDKILPLVGEKE